MLVDIGANDDLDKNVSRGRDILNQMISIRMKKTECSFSSEAFQFPIGFPLYYYLATIYSSIISNLVHEVKNSIGIISCSYMLGVSNLILNALLPITSIITTF